MMAQSNGQGWAWKRFHPHPGQFSETNRFNRISPQADQSLALEGVARAAVVAAASPYLPFSGSLSERRNETSHSLTSRLSLPVVAKVTPSGAKAS